MIEMPKIQAEHETLAMMVGSWRGPEKIHPSPFDQAGGDALGIVTNRLALDGLAVVQDYEQQRRGQTNFRGHGVFRWDGGENAYILYWFDSFGGGPSEMRGSFDGTVLTLTGQAPGGYSRATFDFTTSRQYAYKMEVSPDGKQWSPFIEATYSRTD